MIQVNFPAGIKEATSTPLYQWDYGQVLHIYGTGIIAATIQVHFCDKSTQRTIVRQAVINDITSQPYYSVSIPDGLLENSYSINAFIYVKDSNSGSTTHQIKIPVIARKKPEAFISIPTPTQTTLLENLVNEVNEAVNDAINDMTSAKNEAIADMETNRNDAIDDIETSKTNALNSVDNKVDSLLSGKGIGNQISNNNTGINKVGLYAVSYIVHGSSQPESEGKLYTALFSIEDLTKDVYVYLKYENEEDYIKYNSATKTIRLESNLITANLSISVKSIRVVTYY